MPAYLRDNVKSREMRGWHVCEANAAAERARVPSAGRAFGGGSQPAVGQPGRGGQGDQRPSSSPAPLLRIAIGRKKGDSSTVSFQDFETSARQASKMSIA